MKDGSRAAPQDYWFEVLRQDDTGPAWRQELELVFILQGGGWLELETVQMPVRIGAGDIFAINEMQLRSILLDSGSLAISLIISPAFVVSCSPETPCPTINCRSFLYGSDAQQPFDLLRSDFALSFRAHYKNESNLSVHMRHKVTALLDDLLRYFLDTTTDYKPDSGRQRLRTAVEYIHVHYNEAVTLAQLAEHTFLSGPYLSHIFVKYLGIPFTHYLTQVRVKRALVMLSSNQTITDIAYACGFPSSNAFIDAFKQAYGVTPGQHRRNQSALPSTEGLVGTLTDEGFSTAFATLMQYAEKESVLTEVMPAEMMDLLVEVDGTGSKLQHGWKTVVNAGYARDILGASTQQQLKQLQQGVGFRYLRCKGVVDDDMFLYSQDLQGKEHYSFVYLDEVVDTVLACGAKPMLELGHMPAALAAHQQKLFARNIVLSPPANLQVWGRLIKAIVQHLVKRYGLPELRSWMFAPWITPEYHTFSFYTLEEYKDTYCASYRAIKGVDPNLKVCGAGITVDNNQLLEWFLSTCKANDTLPDVLTFHCFGTADPEDEKVALKLVENNEAFHMAVSHDADYITTCLRDTRRLLHRWHLDKLPIIFDEWSNNIWQRDLCNDTCYKSAYLFKNILENYDSVAGMAYFTLNDRLDEIAPSGEIFCGGFGLFTGSGLPKSAMRAFELLGRVGDRLLTHGDGYFVTASETAVQIFLYNYSHYDVLYRYRHATNLTKTQRYKVFDEKPAKAYHLQVEGLTEGAHAVTYHSISPQGGSTFDAWVALGAPDTLSVEEHEILCRQSHPQYRTELMYAEHGLDIKVNLCPHEVQLITISK